MVDFDPQDAREQVTAEPHGPDENEKRGGELGRLARPQQGEHDRKQRERKAVGEVRDDVGLPDRREGEEGGVHRQRNQEGEENRVHEVSPTGNWNGFENDPNASMAHPAGPESTDRGEPHNPVVLTRTRIVPPRVVSAYLI